MQHVQRADEPEEPPGAGDHRTWPREPPLPPPANRLFMVYDRPADSFLEAYGLPSGAEKMTDRAFFYL